MTKDEIPHEAFTPDLASHPNVLFKTPTPGKRVPKPKQGKGAEHSSAASREHSCIMELRVVVVRRTTLTAWAPGTGETNRDTVVN